MIDFELIIDNLDKKIIDEFVQLMQLYYSLDRIFFFSLEYSFEKKTGS